MNATDWHEKSNRITDYVISHPVFKNAADVYCYINFRKEVCTCSIIETAWKLGKRVAAPKVNGRTMDFFYFNSFKELVPGCYGILEPPGVHKANGENALVIMPGAVFDQKKNRIGYGGGYYDRYLKQHPDLTRMAVAFSFQCLNAIPSEPYDQKPEILVTETGYF